MTTDNSISKVVNAALQKSASQKTESTTAQEGQVTSGLTKNSQLGEQEFLMLLVNQLQHQDPLNPMENEEFAVQLAQFSQLENLIGINEKLSEMGGVGGGSVGMMASFLGHEVVLKDQVITLNGQNNPNLLVDVPLGTQSGRIDFIDENGQIVGTKNLEELNSGKQVVSLKDVALPDGSYSIRVIGVGPDGQFAELAAKVTGTVEGFVIEPEPALLVNGSQIALSDVNEVYTGKTQV